MRDKPDGFDCFVGDGDGRERVSDGLQDVLLVAGVGQARTGVEQR